MNEKISSSFFNDWINLFDEKNFSGIRNEPEELKGVAMLFVTIQKEFKRIESSLGDKLQFFKTSREKQDTKPKSDEETILVNDDVVSIESSSKKFLSSPRGNNSQKNEKKLLRSPIFSRHRKVHSKKNKVFTPPNLLSDIVPLKNRVANKFTPDKGTQNRRTVDDTYIEDDDIFESSIIGVTPNVNVVKKCRSKLFSPRKRLHTKKCTTSTSSLGTFSGMEKRTDIKEKSGMIGDSIMMDIDEILKRVDCDKENTTIVSDNSCSSKSATSMKSNFKDFEVSSSYAADYDRIPVCQRSPKKTFAYKETIRGNEKKKLPGWSCKDCEQFYKGMNLSEDELLKKMNECSKHRSRFKPDEETMPGFWDLTLRPTPEDQKTQSHSPDLSLANDSTVYYLDGF